MKSVSMLCGTLPTLRNFESEAEPPSSSLMVTVTSNASRTV
jgi:hypothetical protein